MTQSSEFWDRVNNTVTSVYDTVSQAYTDTRDEMGRTIEEEQVSIETNVVPPDSEEPKKDFDREAYLKELEENKRKIREDLLEKKRQIDTWTEERQQRADDFMGGVKERTDDWMERWRQKNEASKRAREFDPSSPTFLQTISETFPEVVSKRLADIMATGPQNQEEADELKAVLQWGKLEHDGVTPELMGDAVREADIRTQNLGRVENNKKILDFQNSFTYRNLYNDNDTSLNEQAVFDTSHDMLMSFLSVVRENELEEAFSPLITLAQRLDVDVEDVHDLSHNPLAYLAQSFTKDVIDTYNTEMENRANSGITASHPIDIKRIFKDVFNKYYTDNTNIRIQTPWDDVTSPLRPPGWEILRPEAADSITKQTQSELKEVEPPVSDPLLSLDSSSFYSYTGKEERMAKRAAIDEHYARYESIMTSGEDVGEHSINEHLNVQQNTAIILQGTLDDLEGIRPDLERSDAGFKKYVDDSLKPTPKPERGRNQSKWEHNEDVHYWEQNERDKAAMRDDPNRYSRDQWEDFEEKLFEHSTTTDFQYVASMLNAMGLTNIDTSAPFSAKDKDIYISEFMKARGLLEGDIQELEEAYHTMSDPRKIYDNLMMKYMGEKVNHEFGSIDEVNALIYDVLNNPDNYDDGSMLGILTTYNMASEAFSSALEGLETDSDYQLDLRRVQNNLNNPSQSVPENESVWMFFGANTRQINGLMDQHPTMVDLQETLYSHWNGAFQDNYLKLTESMGITRDDGSPYDESNIPDLSMILTRRGAIDWQMGDTIPWRSIDHTTKVVLTETLIQESARRPTNELPAPLKSLQNHVEATFLALGSGTETANMSPGVQADIVSVLNLTSYMLNSKDLYGKTTTRAMTKKILAQGSEEKMRALEGLNVFIMHGQGSTGFELIDSSVLLKWQTGEKLTEAEEMELKIYMFDKQSVHYDAVNRMLEFVSMVYRGDPDIPNLASGKYSIYKLHRLQPPATEFRDTMAEMGFLIPTDWHEAQAEYEKLKSMVQLTDSEIKTINDSEWDWLPGEDVDHLYAFQYILEKVTKDLDMRARMRTAHTAWVATQGDTPILPSQLLAVVGMQAAHQGLHMSESGKLYSGGGSKPEETLDGLKGLLEVVKDSETGGEYRRRGIANFSEYRAEPPEETLTHRFRNYTGKPMITTKDQKQELSRVVKLLYENEMGEPVYEAYAREMAYRRRRGGAWNPLSWPDRGWDLLHQNVRKESPVTTFTQQNINKEVYRAINVSWANSEDTRSILRSNFINTNNDFVGILGRNEAETNNVINGIINQVCGEYGSDALMLRLYEKYKKEVNQSGPKNSFMTRDEEGNWGWESGGDTDPLDFITMYKPTLIDLHMEVYARIHAEVLRQGHSPDGLRMNDISLAGTSRIDGLEDTGLTIRKYPEVYMELLPVEQRQGSYIPNNVHIFRRDKNGNMVKGSGMDVAWIFGSNLNPLMERDDNRIDIAMAHPRAQVWSRNELDLIEWRTPEQIRAARQRAAETEERRLHPPNWRTRARRGGPKASGG